MPQFVGGNFAAVTGFAFDAVEAGRRPCGPTGSTRRTATARLGRARASAQRTGAMAIEYRWRCADGQYKHFLDQAVLLRGASRRRRRDMPAPCSTSPTARTLEKQLLQARKMDAIGKLTGGIAHDFNNLLAAVLGGLGLIERRLPLDEEQKKIVAMTRHAAEQGVGAGQAAARLRPAPDSSSPAPVDIGRAFGDGDRPARPHARRAGPARLALGGGRLAAPMPTAPSSSWR